MKKKLVCSLGMIITSALLLTGCQVFDKGGAGKEGLVKNIENGIYVMSDKGDCYVPNTQHQNFKDNTIVTSADPSRVVFSVKGNNEIPTLYSDDKLIMYSSDEIPDSLNVEKFSPTGWTLGIYGLTESTNGGYKITKDCLVPESNAYEVLSSVLTKSNEVTLYSIDNKVLDEKFDFTRAGSFPAMEKGEKHTLGVYAGTYYADIVIQADTKLWASQITSTTAGYKRTKDGYAEILIGNLEDGYYNFDGKGLVKVVQSEKRP